MRVLRKILKENKHNSLELARQYARLSVLNIIFSSRPTVFLELCSRKTIAENLFLPEKRTVFRECSSKKTVSFEEQIMSKGILLLGTKSARRLCETVTWFKDKDNRLIDDTTTLTFSFMTIFLSIGRYSKGKTIRQLKLPLPSKDLKQGENQPRF